MHQAISIFIFSSSIVLLASSFACGQRVVSKTQGNAEYPTLGDRLGDDQVVKFAKLALKGIHQEYPNKPNDVLADASAVKGPRELHPAFYGCFDWHSSVHGHWMLVRLLKLYPQVLH